MKGEKNMFCQYGILLTIIYGIVLGGIMAIMIWWLYCRIRKTNKLEKLLK